MFKGLFRSIVSIPGVVPKLLRGSDAGVIFMLHRFPDVQLGNRGSHDVALLRAMLGYLRRHRFDLVSVPEMFERVDRGDRLDGAIAFTIDDGYIDHASVGAPIFADFDCPVTTFLTSGFLDGKIWFWWDKIDFIFQETQHRRICVPMCDRSEPMELRWATLAEREAAQSAFTEACKRVSENEKQAAILRLAQASEVTLPVSPPSVYAPMSWSDARRCESKGMSFGAHTVTHPILARTSDAQSRFEIEESWRRVRAELAQPVSVFCYPNGQVNDFGRRETTTLANAGLRGAVIGSPGYASGAGIRHLENRFYVPRFAMPERNADMIQYATGLERVKDRLRRHRD